MQWIIQWIIQWGFWLRFWFAILVDKEFPSTKQRLWSKELSSTIQRCVTLVDPVSSSSFIYLTISSSSPLDILAYNDKMIILTPQQTRKILSSVGNKQAETLGEGETNKHFLNNTIKFQFDK